MEISKKKPHLYGKLHFGWLGSNPFCFSLDLLNSVQKCFVCWFLKGVISLNNDIYVTHSQILATDFLEKA